MRRGVVLTALAVVVGSACAGQLAGAAEPPGAVLEPDGTGQGEIAWDGSVSPGTETGSSDNGEFCFDAAGKPDPTSGCDFFELEVKVPKDFYVKRPGTVDIVGTGFAPADLDMYVYERRDDGTRGDFVIGDADLAGEDENVALNKPSGRFFVVMTPYLAATQSYTATAKFSTRKGTTIGATQREAPPGFANVRASRDKYTSHSEPTIEMDPLDPNHLMAGSKMYENNEDYLFKVGTYESFDGGRTWTDHGQLPGYCVEEGECDPSDETRYRTVSDPTIAFDDEGHAFINVLDAPGGTFSFRGFNMTAHIKEKGKPWSEPIVVHDNRADPVSSQLLLDDKNWIAVDNHTDTAGGENKPNDGKTGTIYICWSFDGTSDPTGAVPIPVQQIVVMKSLDGGHTWGGLEPGDNTPQFISQKSAISGIGCHISIGSRGEVYITWYDNQLDALMQSKSTDRGQTWTPQYPIATIVGVNDPFEGQEFRNLSIPTTAMDSKDALYVAVASKNAQGAPVTEGAQELGRQIKRGEIRMEEVIAKFRTRPANNIDRDYQADGDAGSCPDNDPAASPNPACSDVILFKSIDGGNSWTGPVRVNQDSAESPADQFQPWMSITKKDQVNISYFDRRNDPQNFFIDTYLARSNDGGATFFDFRVSQRMWDPSVNAPTSVSGKFIGDYQGLVATDEFAHPFWNDTQLSRLPKKHRDYSKWQEVMTARVPNGPVSFITKPRAKKVRGRAHDAGTGKKLQSVRVAVRVKRGKRCSWYAKRKWRAGKCGKRRWTKARGTATWSLKLRRRPAGRYRIESQAVGATKKRERYRERGRNSVTFKRRA